LSALTRVLAAPSEYSQLQKLETNDDSVALVLKVVLLILLPACRGTTLKGKISVLLMCSQLLRMLACCEPPLEIDAHDSKVSNRLRRKVHAWSLQLPVVGLYPTPSRSQYGMDPYISSVLYRANECKPCDIG
jgi:hypothetical protein